MLDALRLHAGTLLLLGALVSVGALVLAFLATYNDRTRLLEHLVGATAGLEFWQVANVHLFTAASVLYLLFAGRPFRRRVGPSTAVVAAAALLATTTSFGALVNSQTLSLQLLALAISAGIIALKANPQALGRMYNGFLATVAVGAMVAVAQKLGVIPYTPHIDASGISRVSGIWHEPDWMGMFSALGIVLAFRLPLRPARQLVLIAILGAALVLSLARAAWGALAVVALIGYLMSHYRGNPLRRAANRRTLGATAVMAGLFLALSPSIRSDISARVDGLVNPNARDVSVDARQAQRDSLVFLARNAPWHGLGLSAAGRVTVTGGIEYYGRSPNNVASNWILGWWVDGKFLGAPLIAAFIGIALLSLGTTGGLLLAGVLVNSLYSNAMMLPIAWFAIGAAIASRRIEPDPDGLSPPPRECAGHAPPATLTPASLAASSRPS